MILRQSVYQVLIVTASQQFGEQLAQTLHEGPYSPVVIAGSVNEAQRLISERSFDIVIVNTPLQDDYGIRFAVDISISSSSCVALFVRNDMYDTVHSRALDNGIFVLRKPTSPAIVGQALDWLCTTRERLRYMEKKSVSLQEKMDEIKLVNRAKWTLITNLNMSEEAAHRYIEKQAMDTCVSKRVIAENILRTYKSFK